jgi:hypothetical protein
LTLLNGFRFVLKPSSSTKLVSNFTVEMLLSAWSAAVCSSGTEVMKSTWPVLSAFTRAFASGR